MKPIAVCVLPSILLASCTLASGAPATAPASVVPSAAPSSTQAASPVPTLEPAVRSTSTPAPYTPIAVVTWADNVLLRANPGYLFAQTAILKKGTTLSVLGRSPGGEWLLVQTSESRVGWVFAQLVEAGGQSLAQAPLIQPSSVQVVIGSVRNSEGQPISGIQFSFVQGAGSNPLRTDAMTDESGLFYSFMPPEATGTWMVSYTAVSCKSNTMDESCNCRNGICGQPHPTSLNIVLPRQADPYLEFIWN